MAFAAEKALHVLMDKSINQPTTPGFICFPIYRDLLMIQIARQIQYQDTASSMPYWFSDNSHSHDVKQSCSQWSASESIDGKSE